MLLLPPRQEEIYYLIKDHRLISFDFIHRRFMAVPIRTLHYDLEILQKKGYIVKIGRTRGALYRLV